MKTFRSAFFLSNNRFERNVKFIFGTNFDITYALTNVITKIYRKVNQSFELLLKLKGGITLTHNFRVVFDERNAVRPYFD